MLTEKDYHHSNSTTFSGKRVLHFRCYFFNQVMTTFCPSNAFFSFFLLSSTVEQFYVNAKYRWFEDWLKSEHSLKIISLNEISCALQNATISICIYASFLVGYTNSIKIFLVLFSCSFPALSFSVLNSNNNAHLCLQCLFLAIFIYIFNILELDNIRGKERKAEDALFIILQYFKA